MSSSLPSLVPGRQSLGLMRAQASTGAGRDGRKTGRALSTKVVFKF
jgi:hypothetical protein